MSKFIPMPPEQKRCPMCGRTLPASDFGLRSNGRLLRSYCRECNSIRNRERYYKPRSKHELGDVFRRDDGSLWTYTGAHWRRHWSPQMLFDLKKNYSSMTNEELATMLGVPLGTLNHKANELGLHKTKAYRTAIAHRHLQLAMAESAVHGNSGRFKPGQHPSPGTEFKKKNT